MIQRLLRTCFAIATMGLISAGSAGATVIDFEANATGIQANGFIPTGNSGVHFTDTDGAQLLIFSDPPTTIGKSLGVRFDDASMLQIDFDFLVNALSIAFGNDDPLFTVADNRALLTLFNGGTQVGSAFTVLNRDDIMNQTVSFSGAAFNSAVFGFTNAAGAPIDLMEVVDNIDYSPVNLTDVPEPASLTLLGAGLIGLGALRRRKAAA